MLMPPTGKDFTSGNRGATGKKNANCSFCRKSYREVGPLVEGPGDVYICGECIELCQSILDQEKRRRGGSRPLFSKVPTPREIVEHLNAYVVGQTVTKKILAVSVHNHYKRLMLSADAENDVEIEKSNILLIGPTGCGKTLMARTLARALQVPFAIGDATTLTEAGYVGLENIIAKRLGKKTIGFGSETASSIAEDERRGLLAHSCVDDIIEFGMIPELVGRLPVISALTPLSEDDLVHIMTEPRNSLV